MNTKTPLWLSLILALLLPCTLQAAEAVSNGTTDEQPPLVICWGQSVELSQLFTLQLSGEGCGEHHYMVVRYQYDANDNPVVLDTICRDRVGEEQFYSWVNSYSINGNMAGTFMLKFFLKDDCNMAFTPISGQLVYTIIPQFNPGSITTRRDTMYVKDSKVQVSVASIEPASGGDGNITYRWKRGLQDIGSTDENLVSYAFTYDDLTFPALVKLRRRARDGSGCGNALAEGVYSIVVFDSLNPGTIDVVDNLEFCSVQAAQKYTITASAAEGGTERYHYQWYMVSDGTESAVTGATNKDLPLSLINLEYGKTYTFYRTAEDDTRFTTMKPTSNRQTFTITTNQAPRIAERVVCTEVFPVTISWYDSNGNEFTRTVSATPDDEWQVVDEHHPSGCAADTTINIRVRLDGYVLSKFDRILYIDNSQQKALHFKTFQWYKDGKKIDGATLNYYDEDGATLTGKYEVEMTTEDGKLFHSCPVQMPQATAIDDLTSGEPAIYPVPAEAGKPVTILTSGGTITIYTCTGEMLMQTAGTDEHLIIEAPQTKGLYYVQIQGRDGQRKTEKLLVK